MDDKPFVFENVYDKSEVKLLDPIDLLQFKLYGEEMNRLKETSKVLEMKRDLNKLYAQIVENEIEKHFVLQNVHKDKVKKHLEIITKKYEIETNDWKFDSDTGEIILK